MKTILSKLSDEKARSEIVKFTWVSVPCAVGALLAVKFLGVLALLFGSRAFILTFHKGNKNLPRLWVYRIATAFASLLGWFEAVLALSSISK